MLKLIESKRGYNNFEANDVKNVSVYTKLSADETFQFYTIDISFGKYGFFMGEYQDKDEAEKIAAEVLNFIKDEELEKYVMPEE